MVRLKLILLLILTAVLSVEPVLHNHSLIPGSASDIAPAALSATCTACSFGTIALALAAPVVPAPSHVAYALAGSSILAPARIAALPRESRGPPSLA